MDEFEFSVINWAAWAPGRHSQGDWLAWCQDGVLAETQAPDVGFVPAGTRRRLSRLARMLLSCAQQLLADNASLPLVFSSRHGELDRTRGLLASLAHDEPLSPTAFSLSVHNAAAGLFSILRQDMAPANVVVAGEDSLLLGLVDAVARLHSGDDELLLVHGDAAVPEPYDQFMTVDQLDHALALRLGRSGGRPVRLKALARPAGASEPLALQLARLLATGEDGVIGVGERSWEWRWC
ncbi:beta-ketoacyl synthase chain length factor [Gallaecimonas sp. GXIMD4217]|uniref:beta-ketoacyl synthase chain length factor n=1 Tax=Gallaecimonas sp. GXIMD4217 TaxID=3131927 RepID=UPI00311AD102